MASNNEVGMVRDPLFSDNRISCLFAAILLAGVSPLAAQVGKPAALSAESTWLDRTGIALDEWIKQASPEDLPRPVDLASALVRVRGNESDRALLRRAMALPPKKMPAPKNNPIEIAEATWKSQQAADSAVPHILLGETDKARGMLIEAREQTEAAPPAKIFGMDLSKSIFAFAFIHFKTPADDAEAIKFDTTHLLVRLAERVGREDLMDHLLDLQLDIVLKELAGEEEAKEAGYGILHDRLAGDLVRRGKTEQAQKFLAKLVNWRGMRPRVAAAEAHYRRKEFEQGDTLLREATKLDPASPPTAVLRLAADFERTAVFRETIEYCIKNLPASDPYYGQSIFRFAGISGDKALFERCEATIFQAQRKTSELQRESSAKDQAECELKMAAGYASAGLHAQMYAAIARADAFNQLDEYGYSEGLYGTICELGRRGDEEIAESLIKKYYRDPEDANLPRLMRATYNLRRGKPMQAFEQAARIQKLFVAKRFVLQARAIQSMVAAGDNKGADAAFATILRASDRAILSLTVADLINGKRAIGLQILGDSELDGL